MTRRRLLFLGVAVLLLVASRGPFLTHHGDWGIFDLEHLWMITDPAAITRARAFDPSGEFTLAKFDEPLFGVHFHAGGRWLTDSVRLIGTVTGQHTLLELKLLGLLLSLVALCAYLATLMRIWPEEPLRWGLATFITWLAPPTLLFWMTLMPMGHYMESWLFHALSLPAVVLAASDRLGPRIMVPIGVACGVACVYVFSNIIFAVLIGGTYLLFTTDPLRRRVQTLSVAVLAFTATWLPFAGSRLPTLWNRLLISGPGQASAKADLAEQVVQNLSFMASPQLLLRGDGFSHRGLLAVLEPSVGGADVLAWLVVVAAVLSVGYLGWHVALLVRPSTRRAMDLPARMLAVNGVLLIAFVSAYLLFLGGRGAQGRHMQYVSYLTLSYPPLLYGMSMGAAALVAPRHRVLRALGALPVTGLVGVLVLGWVHTTQWATRDIDRPDVQRTDYRKIGDLIPMVLGAELEVAEAVAGCMALFPDNRAFCEAKAWEIAISHRGTRDDVAELRRFCMQAAPEDRQACGVAFGWLRYHVLESGGGGAGPISAQRACKDEPEDLRRGCFSGAYRSNQGDPYNTPWWSVMRTLDLCQARERTQPLWAERACLEVTAWVMTGMPLLPEPDGGPVPEACAAWPDAWAGLCQRLGTVRPAREGERSCEEEYLARFVPTLAERNSLVYQQCVFFDLLPDHLDLRRGWQRDGSIEWLSGREAVSDLPGSADLPSPLSILPSCVIGVARALEGVSCSWSGSPLRL